MSSSIGRFLMDRIAESPSPTPKLKHADLENALLSQIHALKPFTPETAPQQDQLKTLSTLQQLKDLKDIIGSL